MSTETVTVTVQETIPPTVSDTVSVTVRASAPLTVNAPTRIAGTASATVDENVTVTGQDVHPATVSMPDCSRQDVVDATGEKLNGGRGRETASTNPADKEIAGKVGTETPAISAYRPAASVGDTDATSRGTPPELRDEHEDVAAPPPPPPPPPPSPPPSRRSDVDGAEGAGAAGAGGGGSNEGNASGINCFGVKSYLHHFYDAKVVNLTPGLYEDFPEEDDDFEYLVDPGKRAARWCHWFRWCVWCGANLLLVGLITLLVGHVTPEREVVVEEVQDHLQVLDRWAVAFNQRLQLCRVAGLVIFFVGGVVVFVTLLASTCIGSNNHGDMCCCYAKPQLYATSSVPLLDPYSADSDALGRIPITEEIESVQPAVEKMAAQAGVGMQIPYY